MIYGEIVSVNLKCHQSIHAFLHAVQRNKNLSPMTKECIKVVILHKAKRFTP